jgi:hypothetical protein
LLCGDIVIARTGELQYQASELPIGDASDRMVSVQRDAREVFHPRAIASFEAAPITMLHPMGPVDPGNWKHLAVGHLQNVHRGEPPDDDKAIRSSLLAFNHASANRGILLTPMTARVLGNNLSELARVQDTSSWQRAADALKADPVAEVSIALPDPRPVIPPIPAAPIEPRIMVPVAPLPPEDKVA